MNYLVLSVGAALATAAVATTGSFYAIKSDQRSGIGGTASNYSRWIQTLKDAKVNGSSENKTKYTLLEEQMQGLFTNNGSGTTTATTTG